MSNIEQTINEAKKEFLETVAKVESEKEIVNLNSKYLKNFVKSLYSELKNCSLPEEKKKFGKSINDFKSLVESELEKLRAKFSNGNSDVPKYDLTLVKNNITLGAEHPLVKLYKKIEKILKDKLGIEIINDKDNNINNLNK